MRKIKTKRNTITTLQADTLDIYSILPTESSIRTNLNHVYFTSCGQQHCIEVPPYITLTACTIPSQSITLRLTQTFYADSEKKIHQ